jgi:hypothetical protein
MVNVKSPRAPRAIVSVWDCATYEVHLACNTRFEFHLNDPGHLDKNPNSQHAGEVLKREVPASLETVVSEDGL